MSDVVSEICSGDRLRGLVALRDELAGRLLDAPARELPVIARRLQSLLSEIEPLQRASTVPNKADQLKARRAARIAGAQGVNRS